MLKKRIVVSFFFLFFFLSFNSMIFARSGCCSHHDGVCGCKCCDGTSLSATCAPYYPSCNSSSQPIVSRAPTKAPTPKLTTIPIFTKTPTPKSTKTFIACSNIKDNQCPSQCGLGNDIDCCNNNDDYKWIKNAGCYPKQLNCSDVSDGKCDWYCSAGNDIDCCEQEMNNYIWYENYGCYPKQKAQCSGVADGICPSHCDNGWDADCCEQNLDNYKWYENWGCYEEQT